MTDSATRAQKLAAEAVGTLVLVLLGCGVFAVLQLSDAPDFTTPLAFGFTLVAITFAFGSISGGHFNPAVSVAAGFSGRLAWRDVAAYAGAQVLGGLAGGLLVFAFLHGFENFTAEGHMGQSYFGDQGYGFAVWAAVLVEVVLTALFVMIVLSATDARNEQRSFAPLAIGLSFAAFYFVSLPLTGGGLNPARSIGVGVFAGTDAIIQLWLFILAPLLGAVVGGLAHPALFGRDAEPVPGSGLNLARPARPATATGEEQVQQERAWTIEEAAAQGWHWDGQAQQWRHVSEGWQPAQEFTEQAAPQPAQQEWAPQHEWPEGGSGERTQIRPPEGQ